MKHMSRYESVTYEYDSINEMDIHHSYMLCYGWRVENWNKKELKVTYYINENY